PGRQPRASDCRPHQPGSGVLMRNRMGAVVLLLLGVSAARAEVIDRVLAIVNDHLITLSDVRRVVELGLANTGRITDATEVVLSQLIDRRLVLDEVERYAPPEPAQAAIAERLIAIQQQVSGPPGLEER